MAFTLIIWLTPWIKELKNNQFGYLWSPVSILSRRNRRDQCIWLGNCDFDACGTGL